MSQNHLNLHCDFFKALFVNLINFTGLFPPSVHCVQDILHVLQADITYLGTYEHFYIYGSFSVEMRIFGAVQKRQTKT